MTQALGIDVSKWQATTPSLAGLDFLFARASIGTQKDERYDQHIAKAKAAGLVTGAYHFGYKGVSAADQARAFLAAAGDVDFYFLDHEGADQMSATQAKAFVAAIKAARGRCGLYASLSGFPDFGQDFNWLALWASHPPTTFKWKFWQYSGSPLDKDAFNGTPAELRAFAGGNDAVADIDIQSATPVLVDLPAGTAILNPDGSPRNTLDVARNGVLSPFTTRSDGGTLLRAIVYGRPDPNPDLLLAVYAAAAKNVRGATPADTTPFSQADIDAAVAAAKAGVITQDQIDAEIARAVSLAIAEDRAKASVGIVWPSA